MYCKKEWLMAKGGCAGKLVGMQEGVQLNSSGIGVGSNAVFSFHW